MSASIIPSDVMKPKKLSILNNSADEILKINITIKNSFYSLMYTLQEKDAILIANTTWLGFKRANSWSGDTLSLE